MASGEHPALPAGSFSAWLQCTRKALAEGSGTDVPCGDCIACCRSGYFIHIRPDETRTLAAIPKKLLFPAPGLPKGHRVLGYDEHGRCPMLIEGKCSIYEDRPLTCRTYDCRVFAAAGIAAGDDDKALLNERVRRWKFSYPAERDREEQEAIRAAAAFLRENAERLPAEVRPRNSSQLAVLAIRVYDVFLKYRESGKNGLEVVKAVVEATNKAEW